MSEHGADQRQTLLVPRLRQQEAPPPARQATRRQRWHREGGSEGVCPDAVAGVQSSHRTSRPIEHLGFGRRRFLSETHQRSLKSTADLC